MIKFVKINRRDTEMRISVATIAREFLDSSRNKPANIRRIARTLQVDRINGAIMQLVQDRQKAIA